MGTSSSKKEKAIESSISDVATELQGSKVHWESEKTGKNGNSTETFSFTGTNTSSEDFKVTLSDVHEEHTNKSVSHIQNTDTPIIKYKVNEKVDKQISNELGKLNKKETELKRMSHDYPISEAEKMLHLYKKERFKNHTSANTNKRDKIKHKLKPHYKTSNLYDVNSRLTRSPTQIESDMVVHPSTSNETTRDGINFTITADPTKSGGSAKNHAINQNTDNSILVKPVMQLTKNVLEERSTYTSRHANLKPVCTGKVGSEKLKLWHDLVEQRMVLSEQGSELNYKQHEAMRELVSTGLVRRNKEEVNTYSMSIGAPLRRPPPRLNQIPPMEKSRAELTDFFSTKIPDIITDTIGNKRINNKPDNIKTNVIVVSEAVVEKQSVNVEDEKVSLQHENAELNTKQNDVRTSRRNIIKEKLSTIETQTEQKHIQRGCMEFIDKNITVDTDRRTSVAFVGETSIHDVNDSGTNSPGVTLDESEYFDALNTKHNTEVQKRKLRLWDVDMI